MKCSSLYMLVCILVNFVDKYKNVYITKHHPVFLCFQFYDVLRFTFEQNSPFQTIFASHYLKKLNIRFVYKSELYNIRKNRNNLHEIMNILRKIFL